MSRDKAATWRPLSAQAASLRVAEQYLAAFAQIAKVGNTMLLPAATNDPAGMVAQAMSIYKTLSDSHSQPAPPTSGYGPTALPVVQARM